MVSQNVTVCRRWKAGHFYLDMCTDESLKACKKYDKGEGRKHVEFGENVSYDLTIFKNMEPQER